MPEVTRRIAWSALAALCALFVVLGLVQASRSAPAIDEVFGISSGAVIVHERDLRMLPEHGLLHRAVPAVLPALFADPVVPTGETYDNGDWFAYAAEFIEANEAAGQLDDVLFWSRVVPVLTGAGVALLIYLLASRLFGRSAGVLGATLWLTTPYILGLSALSSLDVSFTAALVGVALTLDRYREHPTAQRLVVLAAALGASLLVRHTALVLVPVVVTVVVFTEHTAEAGWRRPVTAVVATVLVVLAVLWIPYRAIDPSPVTGPPADRFEAIVATAQAKSLPARLVLSVPTPPEWKAGFGYLVLTSEERPAYLAGSAWTGGRPWYLPMSALLKLPLTLVAMLVIGSGWLLKRSDASRVDRHRVAATVVSVSGAVAAFVILQPLDLGLRLAVPVLALLMVLASGIATVRVRGVRLAVAVVLAVQFVALAAAWPHPLAWSPLPFTPGYRWVSDSSIDIGQANQQLPYMVDLVAASLTAPVGTDPTPRVPRIEDAAAGDLVGSVLVGATTLTVFKARQLSWLRAYCPVDVIGGSILVYRFAEAPDTSPGPVTPASPCRGEVSRRP